MAKTPVRSKVEETQAEVDRRGSGQIGSAARAPSAPAAAAAPVVSTKAMLEDAMTEAENGQWRGAMSIVKRAK